MSKLRNKQRKKAIKTLTFWYNVLLETEYMNDLSNRQEYKDALQILKK